MLANLMKNVIKKVLQSSEIRGEELMLITRELCDEHSGKSLRSLKRPGAYTFPGRRRKNSCPGRQDAQTG